MKGTMARCSHSHSHSYSYSDYSRINYNWEQRSITFQFFHRSDVSIFIH